LVGREDEGDLKMKKGLFFLLLIPNLLMAQPQINQIIAYSNTVELFDKFEANLDISATDDNPFDYDQVAVQAVFIAPDLTEFEVDGFFQQYYELDGNGRPRGLGVGFSVRFSPTQKGQWTVRLQVKDPTGSSAIQSLQFDCIPFSNPNNNGFIRTGTTNYLQFDDKDPFIPIGENMCWQENDVITDYSSWLTKLTTHGGNFFRIWHAHWGLGIEWKMGWQNFEGLRKYE